jgi:hypothetical protein
MLYIKNLPLWERLLRIAAGAAAAAYGLLNMAGAPGWVVAVIGVGIALTGMVGFCPACALAGRRLEKRSREG